jgi:hypothetical protein
MQRPDVGLTSMDTPRQPSVAGTAGITSSRTWATAASSDGVRT